MAELPDTVTTLRCPNGSTVYVVGTAHFSRQSAEDVRKTISLKQPQTVVLELCQDRRMILRYSEETIVREAQNMSVFSVRNFIRRDGLVAGITQTIFLKLSAHLTKQLGVAPGGEFRAGYEEAQKVRARVVLGDRLVGITFKRALAALGLWQRIRFAFHLIKSLSLDLEITPEDVERMRDRDMVSLFLGELDHEFPAIAETFVTERDQILAYSLMTAANCAQVPYGPPVTVVGVMGIGHLKGIEENWNTEIRVTELLAVPQPSRTSRVVWFGVKIGFVGLVATGVVFAARQFFFS